MTFEFNRSEPSVTLTSGQYVHFDNGRALSKYVTNKCNFEAGCSTPSGGQVEHFP